MGLPPPPLGLLCEGRSEIEACALGVEPLLPVAGATVKLPKRGEAVSGALAVRAAEAVLPSKESIVGVGAIEALAEGELVTETEDEMERLARALREGAALLLA